MFYFAQILEWILESWIGLQTLGVLLIILEIISIDIFSMSYHRLFPFNS